MEKERIDPMSTEQALKFAEVINGKLPLDTDPITAYQWWLENQELLLFVLQKALIPAEKLIASLPKYSVIVDYGRNLSEMVASGKYNWVNDDIDDKHFPIKDQDRKEIEVILWTAPQNLDTPQGRVSDPKQP